MVRMAKCSLLWWSGLCGLALAILLTVGVAGAVWCGWPPLVVTSAGRFVVLCAALLFSLAELPFMVVALRKLVAAAGPEWIVALANGAFVFFAAVYAAPYTLLTGDVPLGAALAGLSLGRLGVSVALVGR